MLPAGLAALEHANFVEAIAAAGGFMDGAHIRREDGVATLLSGHPLLLFNQIMVERDDVTAAALGAAVATARQRGHRFVVNLRVGQDDRHIPTVTGLGLVPMDDSPWLPGMALHPIDATVLHATAAAPGVEIRRVDDAAGVEDHIRAAAGGFELPEEMLRSIVTVDLAVRPDAALYVGYVDGEPMVAGLGLQTGTTIGVYNIATVPPARGRGFGAAMTARVVFDGAADGCDVAVLQASEMGFPIYQRMGFATVVEYIGYVEPSPSGDL